MIEKNELCESCSNESIQRINVLRFIDRLDAYLRTNDLNGAKTHLEYWEKEARTCNDECGLLSVLNEKIGFSRRINDVDMAMSSLNEAKALLDKNDLSNSSSGATICTNIATTLEAFGRYEEALPIYDKAEKVFIQRHMEDSFEYASLLNNKSFALTYLKKFSEAEASIRHAIDILEKEGRHDAEIGLSLISLAHLTYDRDENVNRCEELLNKAVEYLESEKQAHDANYAYVLTKCIPSLRYFKRPALADKYEQLSNQIYKG